jgi:hypothetical protein
LTIVVAVAVAVGVDAAAVVLDAFALIGVVRVAQRRARSNSWTAIAPSANGSAARGGSVLMIVLSAEGRRIDQLEPVERLPGVCD